MPFDGFPPLDRPRIDGRINPALVDTKWRGLWRNAEAAVVFDAQQCGDGLGVLDHVTGHICTRFSTGFGTRTAHLFGPTVDFTGGGTNSRLTVTNPARGISHRDMTFGAMFRSDTLAGFQGLISTTDDNNSGLRLTTAGTRIDVVKGGLATLPGPTIVTNTLYFVCFSYSVATGDWFICNTNLLTHRTTVTSGNHVSATGSDINPTTVFGNHAAAHFNGPLNGAMAFAISSNIFMTPDSLRAWARDPFGPFRMSRTMNFGFAAASGVAVFVDAGEIDSTGSGIFLQSDVSLDDVSLSKTGRQLTARIGSELERGNLAVAGQTLSLDQAFAIAQSALPLAGRNIAAGSAQLVPIVAQILGLAGARLSDPSTLEELYAICRSVLRSIVRPTS